MTMMVKKTTGFNYQKFIMIPNLLRLASINFFLKIQNTLEPEVKHLKSCKHSNTNITNNLYLREVISTTPEFSKTLIMICNKITEKNLSHLDQHLYQM